MGINRAGEIYKALYFNGVNSKEYGVYITGEAVYNAPERDVEVITVPGRNGAFVRDNGRFENILVTYPAGIFGDKQSEFAEGISAFRNALCSAKGYCRLTDEYNPDEYREAVYKSGLEVSPVQMGRAGEFSITFECKPQRFLKSGENKQALDLTNWANLTSVTDGVVSIDGKGGQYFKSLSSNFLYSQAGSGTPGLNNVRDITGRTGLYLFKARKNLLSRQRTVWPYTNNGVTYTLADDGYSVIANGTATGGISYCSYAWNFPAGEDTILTGCPAGGSASTWEIQISGGNNGILRDRGAGVTIPAGTTGDMYMVVREGVTADNLVFHPMLRLTDAPAGFEPYKGLYYYKSLAGTYYGGTYDWITGELTITHKSVQLEFATRQSTSQSLSYRFRSPSISNMKAADSQSTPGYMVADKAPTISYNDSYAAGEGIAIGPGANYIYYTNPTIQLTTLENAQAWLAANPITVVYELDTPEVVQLTGANIALYDGLTNVFTRIGDTIIAEYGDRPGIIYNPTLFPSKPLLEVSGYGKININSDTVEVENGQIGETNVYNAATTKKTGAASVSFSITPNYSALNSGNKVYLHGGHLSAQISGYVSSVSGFTQSGGFFTDIEATGNGAQFVISDSFTFNYGTAKTASASGTVTTTSFGSTTTYNMSVSVSITSAGVINITITSSTAPERYALYFDTITAVSTKSALGNPIYLDLDIGEAYRLVGTTPVSVNSAVMLGAELPELQSGNNVITADGTITALAITPRWWKV